MEDLWQTSPSLNDCQYLPDIDVKPPKQRSKAELPSDALVWPNMGDQLVDLPETAVLQSPFAYVAGDKFGAIFNCHREDFDLHSINFLYTGRKIWIIVSPSDYMALEELYLPGRNFLPPIGTTPPFPSSHLLRLESIAFLCL